MKSYADKIRKMGYRVLQVPYNPFYNRLYQITKKTAIQGDSLKILREEYPKYDVIVTNFMNKPFLEFLHPDFIKDFYHVDKYNVYQKASATRDVLNRVTGPSLGGTEGFQWKRKRTILNSVFNFEFIKSHIPTIATICDEQMLKMEQQTGFSSQNNETTASYNILELAMKINSRIILKSFLGYEGNDKIQGTSVEIYLKKLIDDSMIIGFDLLSFILGPKFRQFGFRKSDRQLNFRKKLYEDWSRAYIQKRMKLHEQQNKVKCQDSDILNALLSYKNKSGQPEDPINSEQQLLTLFSGFFLGGTDTTSNFFQMMVLFIIQNPSIQKELREDVAKFMNEDDYSFENLKNFSLIDNIQKQTTRMYGPVNLLWPREAKQDNNMNGLQVHKGTIAYVVHFGNHHSEQYFKEPLKFRPSRWDTQCKDLPPYVMGGFNSGPRTCIGKNLALIESKIALIKFFKRYSKIELVNKQLKMGFSLVVCPEATNLNLTINPVFKQ